MLDTDASIFAVGGVLNQLQDDREVKPIVDSGPGSPSDHPLSS